jgi:hypothetical protein
VMMPQTELAALPSPPPVAQPPQPTNTFTPKPDSNEELNAKVCSCI